MRPDNPCGRSNIRKKPLVWAAGVAAAAVAVVVLCTSIGLAQKGGKGGGKGGGGGDQDSAPFSVIELPALTGANAVSTVNC